MKTLKVILIATLISLSLNGPSLAAAASRSISFQAEVWADNWFELYINGKKVGQDSVPITTERSFNSEKIKFSATYPLTIGVIAKDFTENASGLEYIGKSNQQIGDGGFILQIREVSSGKVISYTNNKWKSFVANTAPTNASCEKSSNPLQECQHKDTTIPKNWSTSTFNDSSWKLATAYTKEAVGVKEGYFDINWSTKASLIWSSDLKLDNTILFRSTVKSATSITVSEKTAQTTNFSVYLSNSVNSTELPISATCDGAGVSPGISWSNSPKESKFFAIVMDSIPGPPRPGESTEVKHFYLIDYNIPAAINSMPEGNKSVGILGQNFLGKTLGYTPPCSQGPGSKIYTITLYALSDEINLKAPDATEKAIQDAMNGKILASTKIDLTYSRVN